ncbi:hypothetical protein HK102_000316 [Quaeritorhiza haematococci]|nr:hypothetical protein HK102_000316 [Quaeritorhiza haematococci]
MSWVVRKVKSLSWILGQADVSALRSPTNQDDGKPLDIQFTHLPDRCCACEAPCSPVVHPETGDHETHAQLPPYLQRKIDTELPLSGSIKPYARHIFVNVSSGKNRSGGGWNLWPSHIDDDIPEGSVVQVILKTLESVKNDIPYRTVATICERGLQGGAPGPAEESASAESEESDSGQADRNRAVSIFSGVDEVELIVFPEKIRYPRITATSAEAVVRSILLSASPAVDPSAPSLAQSLPLELTAYVFICAHKKRDKRCGVAGPMLISEFEKVLKDMGLDKRVRVFACSHTGGHKFAGNVIIYPSGHWYGRVRTCHVKPIIEETILKGVVIEELWRGRISPLPTSAGGQNKAADW